MDSKIKKQKKDLRAGDIMTKKVVVAFENESVVDVARRIFDHDFNGLPVVDINNKVVGIVTQYDLITKGTKIHIPTLVKLLNELPIESLKEKALFRDELVPILDLKVGDIMNKEPLMVGENEKISSLVGIFAEHHKVNPIPIVRKKTQLVGIISRHDIIRFLVGPKQKEWDKAKKSVDEKISDFIDNFQKNFVLTTKVISDRALFLYILFSVFGFFITFALITRFVIK